VIGRTLFHYQILGEISQRRGDRATAAACYRRFLELWGDDLDRDRVASARTALDRAT
jgi:hypothetical protein